MALSRLYRALGSMALSMLVNNALKILFLLMRVLTCRSGVPRKWLDRAEQTWEAERLRHVDKAGRRVTGAIRVHDSLSAPSSVHLTPRELGVRTEPPVVASMKDTTASFKSRTQSKPARSHVGFSAVLASVMHTKMEGVEPGMEKTEDERWWDADDDKEDDEHPELDVESRQDQIQLASMRGEILVERGKLLLEQVNAQISRRNTRV